MLRIVWGSGAWMVPDFFVWVVVLIHAGFMGPLLLFGCLFRLHEGFLATAFLAPGPFSA
ncbi:hypothetical protein KIS4809_0331 [Bacillus sp. ZZV12-4809]|nr:hypothetical protein KIS4809_0331 [Bacillus sp. ZZV12-4809]